MNKIECLFNYHEPNWTIEDLGYTSEYRYYPINRCLVCNQVLNQYIVY